MHRASIIIAILQAAAFRTLNYLLAEYITTDRFWSALTHDPVVQNYHRASKAYWDARNQTLEDADKDATTGQTARLELPAPVADELGDETLFVPLTVEAVDSAGDHTNDFESQSQPEIDSGTEPTKPTGPNWRKMALGCLRTFFIEVLLGPLLYTWHIWLEQLLPSRRSARQSGSAYPASKNKEDDGDDTREEQVIQKWLHQGKIQRSSLSWRNTFAKWAIQWTIGRYWMDNAVEFLEYVFRRETPSTSLLIPSTYVLHWIGQRMSTAPFGTILCFVLVPAPKRLPFLQGIALLWTIFIALCLYFLTPMVVQMEYVQTLLSNMTSSLESQYPNVAHAMDEL